MSESRPAYIRYRLLKAREMLQDAEAAAAVAHYITAVNRMDYACFYAATALLLSEGLSASKHRGVLSLFDRQWVKTGRLPQEMSDFFHDVFDHRLEGDYVDEVEFQAADVEAWLAQAKQFVDTIAATLQVEG